MKIYKMLLSFSELTLLAKKNLFDLTLEIPHQVGLGRNRIGIVRSET